MKCPSCDQEFKNYTAVSLHFRHRHGTAAEFAAIMRQKYIDENHNGVTPTCQCGCGKETSYYGYNVGFNAYIRGHVARVKNNWGHNEEAQKKSQEKRHDMHERGEIKIWNKGETKESDERIAAYGVKISDTFTQEKRDRYSSILTKNRLSGVVRTLYGKEHSQWQGGTSALQNITRSKLHSAWVYPKLKAANFTCQRCGSARDLEVHHDGEHFADILKKAIAVFGEIDVHQINEDFEKKSLIADWVTNYHVDNNVSGIVLCEDCHNLEHSKS